MDIKLRAIHACSCPRQAGESMMIPVCAVDGCVEGDSTAVLFVTSPPKLSCMHLNSFGEKKFCACKKRLQVYQTYRI